ncbi:MAG: hypothetical protein NWE89_11585, partial [Candidatus Bathyarchaeota archaeon]|nr:hypothetical protein [Candidatus Bathyarchaeota archaeon]
RTASFPPSSPYFLKGHTGADAVNPRAVILSILGWCPGVQSAARFLPDKDLPTSKLAASLLIGLMVMFSGFLAAQQLQLVLGLRGGAWRVINESPSLVAADDDLYLFVSVRTDGIGIQEPIESSYRVKIDLHGKVYEKKDALGVGDAIIIKDDLWLLAYTSGGVKVVESTDGEFWGTPVTVAENRGEEYSSIDEYFRSGTGFTVYEDPSLAKLSDGRVLMVFTRRTRMDLKRLDGMKYVNDTLEVYYSIRGVDGEWSPPSRVPGLISETRTGRSPRQDEWIHHMAAPLEPSCFNLLDGSAGVLAVDIDAVTDAVKGILFTQTDGSGWSEPRHLPYIRGRNPHILSSQTLGGYVIAYDNLDQDQVEVAFSADLESWGNFSRLPILEGYRWPGHPELAEIGGAVVVAYERFPDIYLSYREGGSGWRGIVKVENIVSEDALMIAGAARMTVISALTGGALGIVALVATLNLHGRKADRLGDIIA